jgi:hypothetical protein
MYLVISCWEALPGKEQEFDEVGKKVSALLRQQPGVVLLERIKSGKRHWSVHGYQDEATYNKIVQDPNGFFTKALIEHQVEKIGRWISSERGQTM